MAKKYALFIGNREKAVYASLAAAKAAARDDANSTLKWEHFIANPGTAREEEWHVSNDRQDIRVRK